MGLPSVRALSDWLDSAITSQAEPLEAGGRAVQGWIASSVRLGGPAGQATKNALNGVWLGHPLHPALTDVPIGAWLLSLLFDFTGHDRSADMALNVGVLAAVPTAVSGAADWADAGDEPRRLGFVHALLNVGAVVIYLLSIRARGAGHRALGVALSATGFTMASLSAWVGGDLVYRRGTNVNRNAWQPAVPDFVVAANADSLDDGKLASASINVDGQEVPLVVLKRGAQVYALGSVCSHWGGPLAEGKLIDAECVECPWHASQFDFRDGSVRQGPASAPALVFETRIRNGQVEVRRAG
jgi:nitrite reductase/ring-hydroxylating ferredoxin subunit/uncharacterized membrane protein